VTDVRPECPVACLKEIHCNTILQLETPRCLPRETKINRSSATVRVVRMICFLCFKHGWNPIEFCYCEINTWFSYFIVKIRNKICFFTFCVRHWVCGPQMFCLHYLQDYFESYLAIASTVPSVLCLILNYLLVNRSILTHTHTHTHTHAARSLQMIFFISECRPHRHISPYQGPYRLSLWTAPLQQNTRGDN